MHTYRLITFPFKSMCIYKVSHHEELHLYIPTCYLILRTLYVAFFYWVFQKAGKQLIMLESSDVHGPHFRVTKKEAPGILKKMQQLPQPQKAEVCMICFLI